MKMSTKHHFEYVSEERAGGAKNILSKYAIIIEQEIKTND
jgi:hypothetical protein